MSFLSHIYCQPPPCPSAPLCIVLKMQTFSDTALAEERGPSLLLADKVQSSIMPLALVDTKQNESLFQIWAAPLASAEMLWTPWCLSSALSVDTLGVRPCYLWASMNIITFLLVKVNRHLAVPRKRWKPSFPTGSQLVRAASNHTGWGRVPASHLASSDTTTLPGLWELTVAWQRFPCDAY